MQELELWNLDLGALRFFHGEQMDLLSRRLLEGETWEQVSDTRKRATMAATILFKRTHQEYFPDPATHHNRAESKVKE
jgi:hypothetical protein